MEVEKRCLFANKKIKPCNEKCKYYQTCSRRKRMDENICITCQYYKKCGKPEREIKCLGYKEKEK